MFRFSPGVRLGAHRLPFALGGVAAGAARATAAQHAAQRVPELVYITAEEQELYGKVEVEGKLEDVSEPLVEQLIGQQHLGHDALEQAEYSEGSSEQEVEHDEHDEESRDVKFFSDLAVEDAACGVFGVEASPAVRRLSHAAHEDGDHDDEYRVGHEDDDAHCVPEVHDAILGRLGRR